MSTFPLIRDIPPAPVRPAWLYPSSAPRTHTIVFLGFEGIQVRLSDVPTADVARIRDELTAAGARDVRTC